MVKNLRLQQMLIIWWTAPLSGSDFYCPTSSLTKAHGNRCASTFSLNYPAHFLWTGTCFCQFPPSHGSHQLPTRHLLLGRWCARPLQFLSSDYHPALGIWILDYHLLATHYVRIPRHPQLSLYALYFCAALLH